MTQEELLESNGVEESSKETRKTFHHDKSAPRKARSKPKLSEDTLAMQKRYVDAGFFSVAEIAFLMANDTYEDLNAIEKEFGITSPEYNFAFGRANQAVKTALPYFAIQMRAETIQTLGEDVSPEGVEAALAKMLAKK